MAVAVCGMHYTAMSATSIDISPDQIVAVDPLSRSILAAVVSIGLFLILCLAMICVFYDRRFESLAEREAESLRAANSRLRGEIEERQALTLQLLATNVALTDTQVALEAALAEMRFGEERFRATFEQAAIGLVHASFEARIERANARFCEITGYSQDELPGLTFLSITHPDDLSDSIENARLLRTGEVEACCFEKRYIRKDETPVWVKVTTSVQRDASGTPLHFLALVEDIQARKKAEAQRDELEVQLRQSQKLEALGTLAGGIAHDLNNALVPVVGLTSVLVESALEGTPEREWLGLIEQGAKRARDLAGRILTFARRSEPRREPIEVGEFVAGALGLLRASLPATIVLDQRITPVPLVSADEGQLHQVLMNLVSNAAHAIGHHLGAITVAVERGPPLESGLPSVRLSVSDTGCGMDEATRQKIFDPFFTTRAVNEGTGLGLSVAHGIVTSHGGSISVESKLGQGTRFDVLLPVMDEKTAAEKRDAA
jgi:PAS domain S-box-containing protein